MIYIIGCIFSFLPKEFLKSLEMIFDVRKWPNMPGMSELSECPNGYNHKPIKCNFYFHIFRRIFYNFLKQIYNIDTIHIPRNNKNNSI